MRCDSKIERSKLVSMSDFYPIGNIPLPTPIIKTRVPIILDKVNAPQNPFSRTEPSAAVLDSGKEGESIKGAPIPFTQRSNSERERIAQEFSDVRGQ